VIVRDEPNPTNAKRKMLRRLASSSISKADLERVRKQFLRGTEELAAALRTEMDGVIEEYRNSRGYFADISAAMQGDVQRALGQVHDYRQLLARIIQHVNVLLEKEAPGLPTDTQLERCSAQLASIYYAARQMEEKLDAALFILYPERIKDPKFIRRFRFHGLVTQYRKLYQDAFHAKRIHLRLDGESHSYVEANPRAMSIIPHTFIDNALKYAPNDSEIVISFEEHDGLIDFGVTSMGPHIQRDERTRIFDHFYRGEEARRQENEGIGLGLAAAQQVAEALGTQISVYQETAADLTGRHLTTFRIAIPISRP